MAISWR